MLSLDASTLRSAIRVYFDAATISKGQAYFRKGRVQSCTAYPKGKDWLVEALVHGSAPEPYEVTARIMHGDGDVVIEADCSCPLECDCKHVTAALLKLADTPQQLAAEELFAMPEQNGYRAHNAPNAVPFPRSEVPRPGLSPQWALWLKSVAPPSGSKPETGLAPSHEDEQERLLYILRLQGERLKVELSVVQRLQNGAYGQPQNYHFSNLLHASTPGRFVRPLDLQLARRLVLAQRSFNTYEVFLENEAGVEALKEILATDRCHFGGSGKKHPVLALGPARLARPCWRMDAHGKQSPHFEVEGPVTQILPGLAPPWYVDEASGTCGPLETGMSNELAGAWLSAPSITAGESAAISDAWATRAPIASLPVPQKVEVVDSPRAKPIPRLRLYSAPVQQCRYEIYGYARSKHEQERILSFARLEFNYGGVLVRSGHPGETLEQFAEGRLHRLRRKIPAENKFLRRMYHMGFEPVQDWLYGREVEKFAGEFTQQEESWIDFMAEDVPALRAEGWEIEVDDTFQHRIATPESWYTDALPDQQGHDWFGVELGVTLDGEKVNLLPILLDLLQNNQGLLRSEELAAMPDDAAVPVPLPDGRKLLFPAIRARQMLGVLLELLNPNALNASGQLRLPKLRAAELAGEAEWRWMGVTELHDLCTRLKNFGGVKSIEPPVSLRATLRPYQREGLNWLQFLREYEIAGVLADDMGLGKTVQAIAHLLVEKESRRMDRPSLIVAPTSLMTNWRQETERFAPDLRVLVLHGLDRKRDFSRIREHDLVVTSYPLLPRDQAALLEHEFHCVILDEAQFIKNPKTIYAQVACALKARHRLCLTGTPMENHLGELWSLFHFLLPGFLGDESRFNSIFRRPIEKGSSDDRRKLLARRVAPFVLRRKKEEVVKELPPKTEIVQNVELGGAQRDLYESVRLAMHQRVKAEIDKKGISRAHIIILDALLKLRQICCHPQLLRLPSAQKIQESAKLQLLLDLLPEMIEEGRRVLLFSQFTSMLAIIEQAVTRLKIPYVQLTGQTRDRATPVQEFQSGKVPLFLISLKAGGTGLNLTAADTVIHYDPWWNPAVENQATDRAHRIGQDKKVFVYKLMTIGTVEEKILAMQVRKRELVEGLLNEQPQHNLKITADDLDVLFAPLQ